MNTTFVAASNYSSNWNLHDQPEDFQALQQECEELLNKTTTELVSGKFCAGVFDGWLCWPNTPVGQTAYKSCPEFVIGFDPKRLAHKECELNGEWYKHPETNKAWSNYTTCINFDDFEWKHTINIIYQTGYSISLIAVLVSLALLGYFKNLKCGRITLHMHLFSSFAVNNFLWLIWYIFILADAQVLESNGILCKTVHITLNYFLISNYSWMLCEGFYLHTVLISAYISEKKLLTMMIIFGWSSPAAITLIYALIRGFVGTGDEISQFDYCDNQSRILILYCISKIYLIALPFAFTDFLCVLDFFSCWMNSTRFDNILVVPVCISMFLNLIFLCNIVRVVLLKSKTPITIQTCRSPSQTVLQAVRATLLLVPLLGLQYVVTPFRPEVGHPMEHFYEVLSALTAAFQGACVACLFCFFNNEVMTQVKRKWRTFFLSSLNQGHSYAATQVSFVRCGPPLPGEEKV